MLASDLEKIRAELAAAYGKIAASEQALSEATRSANHERATLLQERAEIERRLADLHKSLADTTRRAGEQERALRGPQPSLRLGDSRDPEMRATMVGVAVTVPLWNRREGPIAQAQATTFSMLLMDRFWSRSHALNASGSNATTVSTAACRAA